MRPLCTPRSPRVLWRSAMVFWSSAWVAETWVLTPPTSVETSAILALAVLADDFTSLISLLTCCWTLACGSGRRTRRWRPHSRSDCGTRGTYQALRRQRSWPSLGAGLTWQWQRRTSEIGRAHV